jgi:putative transposase
MGRRQNFTGQNFWARGYYVSTAGLNEEAIKKYIREQETEDKRLDELELFKR